MCFSYNIYAKLLNFSVYNLVHIIWFSRVSVMIEVKNIFGAVSFISLRVSEANEVPIRSHLWVTSTIFKRL